MSAYNEVACRTGRFVHGWGPLKKNRARADRAYGGHGFLVDVTGLLKLPEPGKAKAPALSRQVQAPGAGPDKVITERNPQAAHLMVV